MYGYSCQPDDTVGYNGIQWRSAAKMDIDVDVAYIYIYIYIIDTGIHSTQYTDTQEYIIPWIHGEMQRGSGGIRVKYSRDSQKSPKNTRRQAGRAYG